MAGFNVGLAKVDFELTGKSLHNAVIGDAVHTKGLWVSTWNTKTVPDGTYGLRSVAYNAEGDQSAGFRVVEVMPTPL